VVLIVYYMSCIVCVYSAYMHMLLHGAVMKRAGDVEFCSDLYGIVICRERFEKGGKAEDF
jgi:hypothetical protein